MKYLPLNRLPDPVEAYRGLSLWGRFWFRLWGRVSLGLYRLPDWSAPITVFLFRCQCGKMHAFYREGFAAQLRCRSARAA
ncbi:MAG: hypothetical protein UY45_C0007G0060 [Parcubacteria group bacterium GW2011_GWA1_49_26]|uniref:Uncharacterized protein n=1 Tax=Candidatus Yanofskybacteria bacterium GW2011_GWC1_48_11 TaxID=1619027 RepID=A0A837IL97_9BACT|nr:MAG: hypothetical protein UY25_C0003G0058 [Candidatus Yanofskybacteria bacterium GW2011_GWC1_48_11]KKW08437.1 MAG: hypothetical protein UY45_C0007G0060 [Parcubacteria group bacterium GW2011_GWA1_49_26]